MNAKFRLCLLLVILGTITVQGAVTGNRKKNPMDFLAKRGECFLKLMTTGCRQNILKKKRETNEF